MPMKLNQKRLAFDNPNCYPDSVQTTIYLCLTCAKNSCMAFSMSLLFLHVRYIYVYYRQLVRSIPIYVYIYVCYRQLVRSIPIYVYIYVCYRQLVRSIPIYVYIYVCYRQLVRSIPIYVYIYVCYRQLVRSIPIYMYLMFVIGSSRGVYPYTCIFMFVIGSSRGVYSYTCILCLLSAAREEYTHIRVKREERVLKDGCECHRTAVAVGALTQYIRYTIEYMESISGYDFF